MEKAGKYEILGRIGEGGFGTVWKGRDPFLKRMVAIKTCTAENEDLQKRFLREAEIAGGLHHPNVTTVHDFGYHDGVPFLVQEFLTGEDLSAIIRRRDPVPLPTKLRWLADVARGLEYAHTKGVVHRDVKPGNVRIIEDGSAKVMDFGIAKLAEMNTQQLTKTGTAMGTIGYMAPEQVNGSPVDHRADIFAFGVMAYELLTYQRPFDAETMSRIFYRILHEDPQPLTELVPGVAPDLERVVLRCLAKEPDHRYGSFRNVLDDLEAVAAGRPLEAIESGDATEIGHFAERPTELVSGPRTGRPTPATAGRPATPASSASSTYGAAPRGKLPRIAVLGILLGIVVAAATYFLGRDSAPPLPTAGAATPRGPLVATRPAPQPVATESAPANATNLDQPTPPAPAAAVPLEPGGRTERDARRVENLLAEAERLRREGRREAALQAALDVVGLDPGNAHARRLVEQLAEKPASPPAPTSAPVAEPAPRVAETEPDRAPPAAVPPARPPAPAAAAAGAAAARHAAEPAEVPPAADPEADIRAVLARYERAYESLDADAVAAVWPTLGAQRKRQLEQAFENYRWLKMDLEECAITVSGDTATAACRQRQSFELKVGKAQPVEARVRFQLVRSGGSWRIDALGS